MHLLDSLLLISSQGYQTSECASLYASITQSPDLRFWSLSQASCWERLIHCTIGGHRYRGLDCPRDVPGPNKSGEHECILTMCMLIVCLPLLCVIG